MEPGAGPPPPPRPQGEGPMTDFGSRAAAPHRHARRMPVDHQWYKRAVFYEMLVQAGLDANGDGYGDLPGLTSKLDYLQWLGIDCLWLPPFYDSPRRDGGYDIRDYYAISPEYGTLDDFVTLLDEAHARGTRGITPPGL